MNCRHRFGKNYFAKNEQRLSSVNLIDLSFQKEIAANIDLSLQINNIFNKSYLETSDRLSSYSRG